ncbi:hypothetical protein FRC15_010737 [Serendipita sp. 397]|nr:hypothetical protein FRC15_010737 [Serendipita sp. 397]
MHPLSFLKNLALVGTSMFAMAKIPPLEVSTSSFDGLTVDGAGVYFYSQLPVNTVSSMFVAITDPDKHTSITSTGHIPVGGDVTLNTDGTISFQDPLKNAGSEWCIAVDPNASSPVSRGFGWTPKVAGNYTASIGVFLAYNSGSEPYTYPNSTTVCVKAPYSCEYISL